MKKQEEKKEENEEGFISEDEDVLDEKEEAKIRERLKQLGYL